MLSLLLRYYCRHCHRAASAAIILPLLSLPLRCPHFHHIAAAPSCLLVSSVVAPNPDNDDNDDDNAVSVASTVTMTAYMLPLGLGVALSLHHFALLLVVIDGNIVVSAPPANVVALVLL